MRPYAFLLLAALLPPAPQVLDPRASIEAIQKRIGRLVGEDVQREVDPAALAASLGHDPDKLFAVVRGLDFHPYRGALRGATGALLAGAANDVDRCLLLKTLLGKQNVRFAFGTLTEEQGVQLVSRALAGVPGRSSVLPSTDDGLLAEAGVTEEALAAAGKERSASAATHLRRMSGGFAADRAALEASLKEAGIALTGIDADGAAARAAALRDHVWLQVEREGNWVDLDPSFADAKPGWAPVAAAKTAVDLPAELVHRISLKLTVERLNGDAVESDVLYSGSRAVGDLAGGAIHLTVLPEGFEVAKFSKSLEQQAAKFERFQPVVTWGAAGEQARVFDSQGRSHQSKDGKFGADTGDVTGNRVLGQLGPRKAKTVFAALRLDVETSAPGQPVRTATRMLLDRLTRDGKPALADGKDDVRYRVGLLQAWTIWPAAGPLNDAFFVDRLARMLARDGGIPGLLLDHVDKKKSMPMDELGKRIDPLPLGLIGVAQSSLLLAQGELEPGDGLVFPDRASVLIWKEALVPGAKNEVTWRGGIDLAIAPVGVVAKKPADAARARFVHGLLLTEGESSLLEDGRGRVVSAAVRFRKAREAKVPLVVVRGEAKGAPRLVLAELGAGRVVVMPRDPVNGGTAWWRVDPASGECLGIGDTGEGQAVSEGVLVLDNISIPMVRHCMKFVACLNVGVGINGASMQDAGRECMTDFMKDFVKETLDGAIKQFAPEVFRDPAGFAKKQALKNAEELLEESVDPSYWKLYQQAKSLYNRYQSTTRAVKDLGGLRKRVDLLLVMGKDIAKYANEKAEEGRRNR